METGSVALPGLPRRASFPGKCGIRSKIAGQGVINTPTLGNRKGGEERPIVCLKEKHRGKMQGVGLASGIGKAVFPCMLRLWPS